MSVYAHIFYAHMHLSSLGRPMTAPPRPMTHLDCNCLALRQAARHVTQFYDGHLAKAGLRIGQFGILAMLRRKGALSINALAAELVLDRTTLGRNIQPLERDGLIVAKPSPTDRRSKELHLTPAGERRYEEGRDAWIEAQVRFEESVGEAKSEDMRRLLRSLTEGGIVVDAPIGEDASL